MRAKDIQACGLAVCYSTPMTTFICSFNKHYDNAELDIFLKFLSYDKNKYWNVSTKGSGNSQQMKADCYIFS